MWLTQEAQPTYRTIARFVVSDTIEMMLKVRFLNLENICEKMGSLMRLCLLMVLRFLLTQINTRLFGRKNTIRYDDLNRQKAKKLLKEIKESIVNIDFADDLTVDQLDEICARLEQRIEYLNEKSKRLRRSPLILRSRNDGGQEILKTNTRA